MKVLVCGDRNWIDIYCIIGNLARVGQGQAENIVIQGCARGADSLGEMAAKALGMQVESYPADWRRYGRAAGPIRNQQMLDEGKPDLVLAFHSDLSKSKGTADMVHRARKAGIPVEVIV